MSKTDPPKTRTSEVKIKVSAKTYAALMIIAHHKGHQDIDAAAEFVFNKLAPLEKIDKILIETRQKFLELQKRKKRGTR